MVQENRVAQVLQVSSDNNAVRIESRLGAEEVLARLSVLSTKGKLPGFARRGSRGFEATVFAEPYDRRLVGEVVEAEGGSRVEGVVRLKLRMPALMVGALVFMIWPGVWMTDSLASTYFSSWYPKSMWVTAAWYVPLTLLAVPPLWKQWRRSGVIARGELATLVERIASAVGAGGSGSG